MTKRVFVTIAAAGLIGCGLKNPLEGRERKSAPTGQADVGVLVEHAKPSEIDRLLSEFPQAQVRVLNRDHGLYEIFGVGKEEITARVSGPVENNQFFQLIAPAPSSILSVPGPAGLTVDGLNPCKAVNPGPTAVLNVQEPSPALNGSSVAKGTKIKLSASASQAHPNFPSALKTAFVIVGPDASVDGDRVVKQSEVEFTPDALGVYQVVIVVQDSRDACAMDGVRFVVTSNQPYGGPGNREINVNVAQMRHLSAVSARESWEMSQGEGVTIAIVDSGVNYNHPLLSPNIKVNESEIAGNGVDDDHNGFIDDTVGFDFVNNDAFPYDDEGHGTHVAGLAAARKFGIAPKAKILAVKALTGIGGDVGTISAALRYAVDRGARIVNMSLGAQAPLPHPAIVSAMAYAESKGVIVITSSGNGDVQTGLGFDIDQIGFFPAGLPNANLISVAASDSFDVLAPYSNFGKQNVDVVAPGGLMPKDPMLSTAYENPRNTLFVGMSGTSMAAPVVAGIAAQVLSFQPRLTAAELKELLIKAGPAKPELEGITVSGRHINALNALELANNRNVLF